jgi:hypothetical protein
VQLADTIPLGLSVVLALVLSSLGSWIYPLMSFGVGLGATRWWVNLKKSNNHGYFRALLYRRGIMGYSKAFKTQKTLFIGSGVIQNPGRLTSLLSKDTNRTELTTAVKKNGI